jgi:hypothetical protein
MPMFYMPALDSIQLRFILKRRCSPSQARLIGPFFRLAFVMMKASSGCSLQGNIGHLDSMQPVDMSSVQPPLLHSVKLEKPDNLVNLSSDSSEGALPNVPPPTPTTYTPISDSKYNEHLKSVFIPVGSSGHSNLSWPPCHPNTCEYPSVMQCLKRLASIPGSRNELASIDYDKIAYHKV